MTKIISGDALREHLLGRLASAPTSSPDGWVQALATPGNRELLGLIALRHPRSISELSEFAGRAQPNVSRSLTALINAGLVEVKSEGRVSVPALTNLGRAKARDIGLLEESAPTGPAASTNLSDTGDLPFLSVWLSADEAVGSDAVRGDLIAAVRSCDCNEFLVAKMSTDLNAFVIVLLEHWWRMFYRRDAPYKIGEFAFTKDSSERWISLAIKSTGRRIEHIVRSLDSSTFMTEPGTRYVRLDQFERDLLDNVVRPVVAHMRARLRYDRPIQSKLALLEDTIAYEAERTFARTIGALGGSPYDLTIETANQVRRLIDKMPDEEARLDFASAVLLEDFDAASAWATSELSKQGQRNSMPELRSLADALRTNPSALGMRPWERGTLMARALRSRLNLGADVSIGGAAKLAALFGADTFEFSPRAPASLRGFQSERSGIPTIVIEEEALESTTFILARAAGDFLVFQSKTSCVADLYTDRQAVGRAFAAEFIAPAAGVVRMIEDEDLSIVRVARHYGASPEVVHRQYTNTDALSRHEGALASELARG